jgi:hypothetical protein
MKPRIILVEGITLLLFSLFLYTGISKLLDFHLFLAAIKNIHLFAVISTLIGYAVIAFELILSGLLLSSKYKLFGLYGAVGLLLSFSGYIFLEFYTQPKMPCTCGGFLKSMTWGEHLIFNSLLIFFAILGIILNKHSPKPHLLQQEAPAI